MARTRIAPLVLPICTLALATALSGQVGTQDARMKTTKVAEHIYMLEGRGGNIGLCVGKDGAFLIDDQFAPMVPQIRAAVAEVSKTPVRFLVNTHWHRDHTGGNERFGHAGALIYAHDNVRKRMSAEQLRRNLPKRAAKALPVVTFDRTMTFHWNEEEIHVFHVAHAHTDGDAIIHFKKANVVHMGDVLFHDRFPFIDLNSGGSVQGLLAAIENVLGRIDAKTRIIPGHGKLTDREGLRRHHGVIQTITRRIAALIDAGKSEQEVWASRPSKEYDATWGKGFVPPERFVRAVYRSLKTAKQRQPAKPGPGKGKGQGRGKGPGTGR